MVVGTKINGIRVEEIRFPKDPLRNGLNTSPSMIQVRPGTPGLDYSGPDVFFIGNEEDAELCAVRVES